MNRFILAMAFAGLLASCDSSSAPEKQKIKPVEKAENQMELTPLEAPAVVVSNSDKALALIEAIENKNEDDLSRLISDNFIQHNPELKDGLSGLVKLFPDDQSSYSADILRVGENDEYAFTHGIYDYNGPKVGIELFRFENGKIAEHWAVFESKKGNNPGGNSQIDGVQDPTEEGTAKSNKKTAHKFVYDTYLKGRFDNLEQWVDSDFTEHASFLLDGRDAIAQNKGFRAKSNVYMEHTELVEVYGSTKFALAVSKGTQNNNDVVIFDLFAFENGKITEHWEVVDEIPSEESALNSNGIL